MKAHESPIRGPIRAANPGDDPIEVVRNVGKPTRAAALAKALAEARKSGKALKVKDADGDAVEVAPVKPTRAVTQVAPTDRLETARAAPVPMPMTKSKRAPAPAKTMPAAPAPPAPEPVLPTTPAPKPPPPPKPEPEKPNRVFSPKPSPPPRPEPETPVRVFSAKPAAKPRTAQLRFVGMKPMHVVEAALFAAGKPIAVEEIVAMTGLREADVKAGIAELAKEYAARDTILEVGKAGTKWGMQVKSQASEPAAKFAPMEIPAKTLKTLALIAFHQPLKQSVLVDMVGSKAYDHVHELHERGLIKAYEEGVTKILRTTSLFPEYFGLDAATPDEVRMTMAKLVGIDPSKLEKVPDPKMVYEEQQEPASDAKPDDTPDAAVEAPAEATPTAT